LEYGALVPIAFAAAIPFSLVAFLLLPAARAVLLIYIGCWLFLPVATFEVSGLPDIDKSFITAVSVLFGVMLTDANSLLRLRPRAHDAPMIAWCFCAIATSLYNGLGLYDGISDSLGRVMTWGVPYAMGRIYFGTRPGMELLARAIVIGGVIYAPLCLWEVRMSPQLHNEVYGYYPHDGGFVQAMRGGGFRPVVFMTHGLMVGFWMSMSALVAVVLWRQSGERRLGPLPMWAVATGLVVTSVLCKSSAAMAMLFGGLAALAAVDLLRTRAPLFALLVIPALWTFLRGSGLWDAQWLIDQLSLVASERGVDSFAYRVEAEGLLAEKAREQPIFGWGNFGRGIVAWDKGPNGFVVPDGLWIINFNTYGLVGLTSWLAIAVVPCIALLKRLGVKGARRPDSGAVMALLLVLMIYFVDCLLNAMVNPIFMLIPGAMAQLLSRPRRRARVGRPPRRLEDPQPEAAPGDVAPDHASVGAGEDRPAPV